MNHEINEIQPLIGGLVDEDRLERVHSITSGGRQRRNGPIVHCRRVRRWQFKRLRKVKPAFGLIGALVFSSILVPTEIMARSSISSDVQLSNIHLSPGAGTISWLSDWQLQTSAGSFDTVHGFVGGGQSASGQPSSASTSAVGAYSSAFASASINGSGNPITVQAGSLVTYPHGVFDSAFANAVAVRDFEIIGVTGLVPVSAGFDFLGHLIGDQLGKGADFRGLLSISDGTSTFDLTAYEKHSGLMNLTFSGSRNQTFSLQGGTAYSMTLSTDPDNLPDAGPGIVMSALILGGLFAYKRSGNSTLQEFGLQAASPARSASANPGSRLSA